MGVASRLSATREAGFGCSCSGRLPHFPARSGSGMAGASQRSAIGPWRQLGRPLGALTPLWFSARPPCLLDGKMYNGVGVWVDPRGGSRGGSVYSDPPLGALTPLCMRTRPPALPYGSRGGGLGRSTRGVEGGSVNPDPPLGALTPLCLRTRPPALPYGSRGGSGWIHEGG